MYFLNKKVMFYLFAVVVVGAAFLMNQNFSKASNSQIATDLPNNKVVNVHSDLTKRFSTVAQLSQDAEVIVLAEVGSNGKSFEYAKVVFTTTDVRINKAIKGDFKAGESISVLETGGALHDLEYRIDDVPVLKQGEKVLLFLEKFQGAEFAKNSYLILVSYQGKFILRSANNKIHDTPLQYGLVKDIDNLKSFTD